ncbi:MAG: tetratricopeptide repeat protein [Planctomycetes bacterium]|nr:tetratricopeptide repeat protein [Planctomycetota bacterium]
MRKLGKGLVVGAALVLIGALSVGCAAGKTYTQNGEQISIDEGLYVKALNYQRDKDYARALHAWEELLDKEPRCALAHANRGKIYDALNMVPDAIQNYESAMRYDPSNTETMANLGAAYLRAGRVNQALDILNDCVSKDPYRATAHFCLSGAYLEAKQFDKAILHADVAVDLVAVPSKTTESGLDPTVDRERLGMYLLRQAECHIERGEFEKAKACIARVEKQCNMTVPVELTARIPAAPAEEPKRPN